MISFLVLPFLCILFLFTCAPCFGAPNDLQPGDNPGIRSSGNFSALVDFEVGMGMTVGMLPGLAASDIAYYGIKSEDRKAVDAILPDQPLISLGMIDVTRPPFSADQTGRTDATKAINDEVFFGRHHKLAVWFPLGNYTVSDTISCAGGWSDECTPNHKYLPFTELWPCVLIGERREGKRPVAVLSPDSEGFADAKKPKPASFYPQLAKCRADQSGQRLSRQAPGQPHSPCPRHPRQWRDRQLRSRRAADSFPNHQTKKQNSIN